MAGVRVRISYALRPLKAGDTRGAGKT